MIDAQEVVEIVRRLTDPGRRVPLGQFPRLGDRVDLPGLYAWNADPEGAAQLSDGVANRIAPGLIYAGQAGAGTGSATLGSRIARNHGSGNIRGSTFRLTLASVLARGLDLRGERGAKLTADGEARISRWMREHLEVAVSALANRARLAAIECEILARLDPPLNLRGMLPTPTRSILALLRGELTSGQPSPRRVVQSPSSRALAKERE